MYFGKSFKTHLVGFLLFVALFYILHSQISFYGLDISALQLVLLPGVLYFLHRIRILGTKIPNFMFLLALFATGIGTAFTYSFSNSSTTGVVVARIEGDRFESESRVLRERLNHKLAAEGGPKVSRYFRVVSSHAELGETFAGAAGIQAVVWGNEGWLQLSFPDQMHLVDRKFDPPLSPVRNRKKRISKNLTLRPVTHVPVIGFTARPKGDTARFLSALLAGLFTGEKSPIVSDLYDWSIQETLLQSAARIQANWSSYAHRSYPLWILGERYLREAFRDGGFQQGEFDCAMQSFDKALSYLHHLDNPELRAALLNNKAVGLLAKASLSGYRKGLGQVKTNLKGAAALGLRKNRFKLGNNASLIANRNLKRIKKLKHQLSRRSGRKRGERRLRKGRRHSKASQA